MDIEEVYYVNFRDNPASKTPGKSDIGLDNELVSKAESLSTKWTLLLKNSSSDEDVKHVSRIIQTAGVNYNYSKRDIECSTELIVEKHNLILLNEKYFQFENNCHNLKENSFDLDQLSTVFDETCSLDISKTDNTPKKKKAKTKKCKKKQSTEITSERVISSETLNSLGAPPGEKVNTRHFRRNIDLTKNANYSLRFRL